MTDTLLEMLTYARPMGSRTETKFRRRYLLNLPGARLDTFGNIHVQVGPLPDNDTVSVLWSCHTDTAHRQHGRQSVIVRDGVIQLAPQSTSSASCLGADDTVGVYLLREMILAGKPGAYLFHFGEERGCVGARQLARDRAHWLMQFDCAIALDRRGTSDIITHQCGSRGASDAFAASLSLALTVANPVLAYRACDRGLYTDTAEYMDDIAECTNLSVGYSGEHGRNETVLLAHVEALRAGLLALDTSQLVIARTPGDTWDYTAQCIRYLDYLDEGDDDYGKLARTGNERLPSLLDDDLTVEQSRDLYDRFMAEARREKPASSLPLWPARGRVN